MKTHTNLTTKIALLITGCVLFFNSARAQYMPIDSFFRQWFVTNGHSECVNGNFLDTTCAGLDSITILNCTYSNIRNLNGVQYMHNLRDLEMEYDWMSSLPSLPDSLKFLDCSFPVYGTFTLPALPAGLDSLSCGGCQITALPVLPAGLIYLNAESNPLTSATTLPGGLVYLNLSASSISSLPVLPQTLVDLYVSQNRLTSLPTLPQGLHELVCYSNQLTALPALPSGLLGLGCYNNDLSALPALPASLVYLNCDHNNLTTIPVLPDTMQSLYCGYNPLISYPVLPLDLNIFECDSLPQLTIPTLSANLYYLECMYDNLTSLPASTPARLAVLICSYNQLTSLAPVTVISNNLDCSHNQFTSLIYANDGNVAFGSGGTIYYPTVNCSYNKLTSVTLNVLAPTNVYTYPPGPLLGDFNCSYNPTLKCLTYLPNMQTFEWDSTGITCLPNFPIVEFSGSPSIANLTLCDTGNASGCPPYDFYVDAGPKIKANCSGYGVQLNATVYSGFPPYVCQWAPSAGLSSAATLTPTARPAFSTWYYITVTDSHGKQAIDSVFVINDTVNIGQVTITNSGCGGNITATVCVPPDGGTPPYKYYWYSNVIDTNFLTACVSNVDTGSYYVTIMDSLNCSNYTGVSVYGLKIDSIATTYNCRAGTCNAVVAAEGGTTPLSYLWSNGYTLASDTGIAPGTYSVTVTDSTGCSVSVSVILSPPVNSNLVFDSVITYPAACYGSFGSGCAYPSGGAPPYTYAWSDGFLYNQQCINGFYVGTYTVSVTDSLGCIIDTGFTITQASPLGDSLSVTYTGCQAQGSLCAFGTGGTPPYYYYWSDGKDSACISNLVPGIYDLTISDSHSCYAFDDTTITALAPILIDSFNITNVPCYGDSSGSACPVFTVNPGVVSYQWSTGATTSCLDSVFSGIYTLTVSNSSGCTTTGSATINQPASPVITSLLIVSCGPNNNSACINASGGTPGYTYLWSGGQTTRCDTGLALGVCSVTVTDSLGCIVTDTGTVYLVIPIALMVAAPDTNAVPDSVSLAISGGTAPYYVNWGDGQDTTHIGIDSNIEHIYQNNGVYNAVIIDSNGCTSVYVFDAGCSDQCVWPGDANYDGIVSNLDLLSIGLAYDSTGYARYNPTINFIPQYCQSWADTLPGGVNYKHADCNGDGIIDADDTLAIVQNYSLTHPRGSASSPGGGTPVYPYISEDTVYNGDTLAVEVMLGNTGHLANSVYGIAFTLTYDPAVVDTAQVSMVFSNAWPGTPAEKINLARNIPQSGRLECAVTRIDHVSKSGEGTIGTAIFVITTDNLNGKDYSFYDARFMIEDVTLIDSAGNVLPVTAGYDTTLIGYLPTSVKQIKAADNIISLYPNPASNQLEILSGRLPVTGVVINSVIGSEVKFAVSSVSGAGTMQKLDISALSPGVYMVEVQTKAGTTVQKLVVTR